MPIPRVARRLWRRLRSTFRGSPLWCVYAPAYARSVSGVPMDPLRGERILAFLTDQRLVPRGQISRPRPVSLKNLLLVHQERYLESLTDPATLTAILGVEVRDDELQATLDVQRLIVGGTIQATRLALGGAPVAVNLGGGLHHATPERGMGFCVYNDVAVAIARLRSRGYDRPVCVVDLDLHDGNGTRVAFASDPTVHTFSIHHTTWDDRPAVAATTIALGADVDDERYLATLREALPPVLAEHRPGLVIYLAGADPAADDALGDWAVSADGMVARDRFVAEQVRALGPGVAFAVLLAGGYGRRAWRHSARFLSWLAGGRVVDPEPDSEEVLRRYRRISHELAATRAPSAEAAADWGLTEEDLHGLVASPPPRTRILGRYSRHDLELMLERLGLYAQLRALGYRPTLELDFTSPLGETIRLFGHEERQELLLELRIDRNHRVLPGHEVLYVEWLLLQNPRREFSDARPRLPGQDHPGLGMLREVAAWLIVMAEALGLEGVVFVPSHYYMAALGRHVLQFLEPAHRARFEAFRRALAGLSLKEASLALEGGRVRDARTGEPVRWEPVPMVIPVRSSLKRRVAGSPRAGDASAEGAPEYVLTPAEGAAAES